MWHAAALICGYALDALLGDPYAMPHIIRLIGALIAGAERVLRRVFPATRAGERVAGMALVLVVTGLSTVAAWGVLAVAYRASAWLGFAVEAFVCYQMLAAKQLRVEALRVRDALEDKPMRAAASAAAQPASAPTADDDKPARLAAARTAVSMIVGRDTAALDEAGVVRAAVETVAENASDGVVAPLLFMAVGGAVGGVLYKAVNTMDSMVGYKNERYRFFGTAAALLDDALNFVPARLTGVLMCVVAPLVGLDGAGAWRVFLRDRRKHASPNSAHPEAACAGALGVRLAGPASYFGVMHDKPYIGDDLRAIEPADITRACTLLAATSLAALVLSLAVALALALVSALVFVPRV